MSNGSDAPPGSQPSHPPERPPDLDGSNTPEPPPRSPRSYRPDLRPLAILVTLIVVVIIGWLFISPAILPPAR